MLRRLFVPLVAIAAMVQVTSAQWLNYPAPGLPRTRDGKVNLAAKALRTSDGKPDLSGVWHVFSESLEEKRKLFGPDFGTEFVPGMEPTTISKYAISVLLDYKPDDIVMTPEANAKFSRHQADQFGSTCLPFGTPLATLVSEVQKIVQAPGVTVIMHELDGIPRQIYTDGRKLPVDPSPSWLGYSIGRWDGDTFVVETNGLNDKVTLDFAGHPRSEAMRMTERYRRRDIGHLDEEITFDDPKMYNRPFTVKLTHLLQPDTDILEYVCNENEKDRTHIAK